MKLFLFVWLLSGTPAIHVWSLWWWSLIGVVAFEFVEFCFEAAHSG